MQRAVASYELTADDRSLPTLACHLPTAYCLLSPKPPACHYPLSSLHSTFKVEHAPTATFVSPYLQARFRILKILADEPKLTQRELAARLGISLGKSNYLLKALIGKGLIKLANFQMSESKLKYVYLLTPAGIRERIRLTGAYLARKEAEYDALKAEIEDLKGESNGAKDIEKAR